VQQVLPDKEIKAEMDLIVARTQPEAVEAVKVQQEQMRHHYSEVTGVMVIFQLLVAQIQVMLVEAPEEAYRDSTARQAQFRRELEAVVLVVPMVE
jgi:hypothetical protein